MATNGSDGYEEFGAEQRFVGSGFGTLMLRSVNGAAGMPTPEVVSRRAWLRKGLPAVYQDSDFAMRFVGALEEVLDPIVATLDGLHHHLDPDHAPQAFLDLLCAWMGVEPDEDQPLDARREVVRRAGELGRRRGTVRGLELALALSFPDLPLRVEDEAGVTWPGGPAPSEGPARVVIYCDAPIPEEQQAAVARCIEREKPLQAPYRLRVKAARKPASS